jgi:hypothetical protein
VTITLLLCLMSLAASANDIFDYQLHDLGCTIWTLNCTGLPTSAANGW